MDIDIFAIPGDPERRRVGEKVRLAGETVGVIIDIPIDRRKRVRFDHLVIPTVGD